MSASSKKAAKSGLFGYFKGLFHRKPTEESSDERAEASSEAAQEAASTDLPAVPPVEIAPPPAREATVMPAVPAAPARINRAEDRDRLEGGLAPSVTLPLQPILDGLPSELRNRVIMPQCGDLTVEIPIDKILSQLASGQIRVPFGDIRKSAPHAFSPSVEYDRISVSLPLGEILPRLNPALLVRRAPARQVEVPEDVASPFEGRDGNVSFSLGNTKPAPAPAAPPKAAPAPSTPGRGPVSSARRPSINPSVAEIPAPFPFTPPGKDPAARVADHPFAAPANAPARPAAARPAASIPMRPAPAAPSPKPAAPIPMPRAAAAPASTLRPSSPIPMSRPATPVPASAAGTPRPVAAAPAPAPAVRPAAPIPAARPVAPTSTGGVLQTALAPLAESWPEPVRQEMQSSGLGSAQVALPADQVEAGLKRGKVTFSWRTVRGWITPAVSPAPSAQDDVELDLPLKVLAPLFMARKTQATQAHAAAKSMVDDSIPDPFAGPARAAAPVPPPAPAPTPAPTPTVAPAPVAPAAPVSRASLAPLPPAPPAGGAIPFNTAPLPAAAAAAAAPAPTTPVSPGLDSASAAIADSNYYLWENASETKLLHIETLKQQGAKGTEFTKRYSSPNEIVARAAELKGVAGALVALPDGLMVASKIPEDQNGDTLAAFLPQIFVKVSACTKELRLGELNNVGFTVGDVPWKIFRVNAIFFAVFGIAGQRMPSAEIASLARELDRKVNQ
jgi:predicted regulator of Ras-like GTPase activity (Roadblock/LC7/MglB family)